MPISPIVLQRRHAELGRIRLGDRQSTSNGRTRPNKLSEFRFTSPSERYIRDLAELYGGEAREWDNNGKAEWEVYTTARSVPVIAVRGGLSQWLELWSGGGLVHRCTGERDVEGNVCSPDDPNHQQAKPTTRLSVMLPELEAIGVWRMETHGWNAAAEIPAVAELAMHVGDLVPAHLNLVERRTVKDGKTSRFVVPVLDLQIGTERLKQIAAERSGQVPAQVAGGPSNAPQIEAAPTDYESAAADATTPDELKAIWRQAGESGHLTDTLKSVITERANALTKTPEAGEPPQDGTADTPPSAPANPSAPASGQTGSGVDDAWMRLVMTAGKLNVTEPQLRTQLEQEFAQPVEDLDAEQLESFIEKVQPVEGGDAA